MEDILNNNNVQPPVNPVSPTTPVDNSVVNTVMPTNTDNYVVKEPPAHGLDSSWRRWKCLNCGYVYEGLFKGTMVCPRCGNNDPDKFDEAD